MIRRFYIILIGIISLFSITLGQDLSVQSSIDKSEMLTGQQANITLNIRTDNLSHTSYAITKTEEPLRFRILETNSSDTVDIDSRLKEFKVNILITSFDSTLITIPAFVVSNGIDSVLSNTLTLKVTQPQVDISKPDNISPYKGFWSIGLGFMDYIYIITHSWIFYVSILIIIVVILAIYLYRRGIKHSDEVIIPRREVILTPLKKAQRDFANLDRTDLLIKSDYKAYYTECFDIVRRYIEDKRGWETLEKTSEEILDLFEYDSSVKILYPDIKKIIRECDLVKFAKFIPSRDMVDNFRKQSYLWIESADKVFSEETTEDNKDKEVQL